MIDFEKVNDSSVNIFRNEEAVGQFSRVRITGVWYLRLFGRNTLNDCANDLIKAGQKLNELNGVENEKI